MQFANFSSRSIFRLFQRNPSNPADQAKASHAPGFAQPGTATQPAPNPSDQPTTPLGAAFYGQPSQNPGVETAKAGIAAGFAKPAVGQTWRGTDVNTLPASADPASVTGHTPPGGEKPSTAPAAEPSYTAEPDPALMGEFNEIASSMRLQPEESDRLMALHRKAVEAHQQAHDRTADAWRAETTRSIPAAELGQIQREFNARLGTDADAAEFKRLLTWSGIGNHPAAVRAIARLMRGR